MTSWLKESLLDEQIGYWAVMTSCGTDMLQSDPDSGRRILEEK